VTKDEGKLDKAGSRGANRCGRDGVPPPPLARGAGGYSMREHQRLAAKGFKLASGTIVDATDLASEPLQISQSLVYRWQSSARPHSSRSRCISSPR
jgi:hypothetical protein